MRSARRSGKRKSAAAIAALLVALSVGAALAGTASAAPSKFVHVTCDSSLPGGNPPSGRFVANPGVPFTPFQNCATPGGSIGITETGPTSATFGYWSIDIPATPGGYVESLALSAAACGLGAANNHTFVYEQGWPGGCAGETQRIFRLRSAPDPYGFFGGAGFNIMMNCDGNVGPCNAGPTIWARYITATQVDVKAPSLSGLEGTLLAGGVIRGDQDLRVSASDEGGGISKIELAVNGLPAGQPAVANCNLASIKNPNVEGTVALTPTPCPTKLKGEWLLDTSTYPFQGGANTVQVCVSDFSTITDANRTCSAPQTINVDNSCTESPVPGGEVINAQFASTRKEEVTVPFDTAAKVVGELSNNAGDAISGATICVQMQTQGSRKGPQPVGTATTDARGQFVFKVPPGPNRKVLVGYRHNRFQVARSIRYYARAKPTLKLSAGEVENGGEIKIRGSLPGRQAGGRVVVLQASALHSDRWFTFRRATTNADGNFRARYRFDATSITTVYRIRAVVPRQRGYPWEAGNSKPALVEVRG
ncbi:MAG: hypothetical protein R2725_07180 [Solirubrobacterales bacterium]